MFIFFVLLLGLTFFSCKHEPETVVPQDTIPNPPPPPPEVVCSPDTAYFQNDVYPVILSNCAKSGCHDLNTHAGGVTLISYESIIFTGDVKPGNPGNSELYKKITETDPNDRMPPPPNDPLTSAQISLINTWILQGALNNVCLATQCDSVNVTYANPIKDIVQTNCLGCHSGTNPAYGMGMETYSQMVAVANSGRLMGALRHETGYFGMPKFGNKLSECKIAQFNKWILDGTPQ